MTMTPKSALVPTEVRITPDQIPKYRAQRHPTTFQGCTQINQIFLKADGKITCSCIRYYKILEEAKNINAAEWYNGQIMTYIRDSFKDGLEPFSFCAGCIARKSALDIDSTIKTVELHIEPSSQCNLFCSACICTDERLSDNPPPRSNLDFALFEKMAKELAAADLTVGQVAFVGFGEPLFNSDLPQMASLSRALFPDARIYVDTNGNFGTKRAAELADCGLSEIRLALDGTSQEPYAKYRASGDFNKALAFAATLANEIRARGSKTKLLWKYILFRHNDTDAEILKALDMAEEIGISLQFDVTYGELASQRSLNEVRALARGRAVIGSNIDSQAGASQQPGFLQKARSWLRQLATH
ncbi:radical SAM protein [Methylovirgula sp. HY1]|uniref:radical SAM protein n=1 Tax=Methylovirgula sp. HY1 TaxID=2822761 RepID=UPI001C5B328E|nr:radical SAM protein [Methylovirgula sp. HY1]